VTANLSLSAVWERRTECRRSVDTVVYAITHQAGIQQLLYKDANIMINTFKKCSGHKIELSIFVSGNHTASYTL